MKLYRLVGRVLLPFQLAGFYVYNHLFPTPRARALVWNEKGELLLIRNWSGKPQWGLPGGGVKKGEGLAMAAKRELYEETGIDVAVTDFTYVTTLHYQYEAPIYSVRIDSHLLPSAPHNPWEITDLRWFAVDNLPSDLSPLVRLALEKLSKSN